MALVRDSLIGVDRESLKDACTRPHWTVAHDDYYAGHHFTSSGGSGAAPGWKLLAGGPCGQMELAGLAQYIIHRRSCAMPRPALILHPWQADPPLPSKVVRHFTSPPQGSASTGGMEYSTTQWAGLGNSA